MHFNETFRLNTKSFSINLFQRELLIRNGFSAKSKRLIKTHSNILAVFILDQMVQKVRLLCSKMNLLPSIIHSINLSTIFYQIFYNNLRIFSWCCYVQRYWAFLKQKHWKNMLPHYIQYNLQSCMRSCSSYRYINNTQWISY